MVCGPVAFTALSRGLQWRSWLQDGLQWSVVTEAQGMTLQSGCSVASRVVAPWVLSGFYRCGSQVMWPATRKSVVLWKLLP